MPESFVAAAKALEDSLADLEPRLYSGEDAARGVEVLARAEKVCAAAKVRMAARAAECGAHKNHGYRDASDWLARQTGTSAGEARAQIETANALEDLPETRQAS